MAEVVFFPLARRRAFIERHARLIASMSAAAGERHLVRQLEIQFDVLERKGVACDVIEREVLSLGRATVSGLLTATNSVQLDTSRSGQPYTANDTKTSSSSGGTEARPKNVALLACIKY